MADKSAKELLAEAEARLESLGHALLFSPRRDDGPASPRPQPAAMSSPSPRGAALARVSAQAHARAHRSTHARAHVRNMSARCLRITDSLAFCLDCASLLSLRVTPFAPLEHVFIVILIASC